MKSKLIMLVVCFVFIVIFVGCSTSDNDNSFCYDFKYKAEQYETTITLNQDYSYTLDVLYNGQETVYCGIFEKHEADVYFIELSLAQITSGKSVPFFDKYENFHIVINNKNFRIKEYPVEDNDVSQKEVDDNNNKEEIEDNKDDNKENETDNKDEDDINGGGNGDVSDSNNPNESDENIGSEDTGNSSDTDINNDNNGDNSNEQENGNGSNEDNSNGEENENGSNEDNSNGEENENGSNGDNESDIGGDNESDSEDQEKECNHVNVNIVDYKERTCVSNGYSGDKYCIDCGVLIEEGTIVEALGHIYDEHFCINCGEFSLRGTYLGNVISNTSTDEFGNENVYEEYDELVISLTKVTLNSVRKSIEKDQLEYTFNGEYCAVNYVDSTLADIDALEVYGFNKTETGYEKEEKTEENGWDKIVKITIILESEGFGLQTTETIYKKGFSQQEYEYENGMFTMNTNNGVFEAGLNLATNTFAEKDYSLVVQYYINGKYHKNNVFADYTEIENYIVGVEEDISIWYTNSECTDVFDAEQFNAEEHKVDNEYLILYSQKDYYNTFIYNEVRYTYQYNEYDNIQYFSDIFMAIMEAQNTTYVNNYYKMIWSENGDIVDTFTIPNDRYSLTQNHEYVLQVEPLDGYVEIRTYNQEDNSLSVVYALELEVNSSTYLKDVLINCLELSNDDILNYTYSYVYNGDDGKDVYAESTKTSNYISNNVLAIYVKYCGVTIKYVYDGSETPETVSAGEEYVIKEFANVELWFAVTESGDIVAYNTGDTLSVNGYITLYSGCYVIISYSSGNFIEQEVLLTNGETLTLETEIIDGYTFLGWALDDDVIYSGVSFDGSLSEFLESTGIDGNQRIILETVFIKESRNEPTVDTDGLEITEKYIGKNYTKEEISIPFLSEANGYAFSYEIEPTLFNDGVGVYTDDKYGTYRVTLNKLTEYEFIYENDTIKISLNDNNYTLSINDEIIEVNAIIDKKNQTIKLEMDVEPIVEYKHTASLSADGVFEIKDVSSVEEIEESNSINDDGNYVGYTEINEYYVSLEDTFNVYDSSSNRILSDVVFNSDSNSYSAISYVYEYMMTFTEKNGQYYMWYYIASNNDPTLPNGEYTVDEIMDKTLKAYQINNDTLTISQGKYNYNGEEGDCYYDSEKKVYVLTQSKEAEYDGYIYELKEGQHSLSKYKN